MCLIALTASAFAEDCDACKSAGMEEFLSKPVRLADLKGALAAAPAEITGEDRT